MLCGATAAASVLKNGEMKCKTNAKISPCLQMWNPSEIEIKLLYTNMLKDLESMLLYRKCEMITSKYQNGVQQFDCQLDKLFCQQFTQKFPMMQNNCSKSNFAVNI